MEITETIAHKLSVASAYGGGMKAIIIFSIIASMISVCAAIILYVDMHPCIFILLQHAHLPQYGPRGWTITGMCS